MHNSSHSLRVNSLVGPGKDSISTSSPSQNINNKSKSTLVVPVSGRSQDERVVKPQQGKGTVKCLTFPFEAQSSIAEGRPRKGAVAGHRKEK